MIKKISAFCFLAFSVIMMSCSGGEKRVLVTASGNLTVNDKTIKLEPGLTHNEKELFFTDKTVTLTLQNTEGSTKTFELQDNGSYLLNLQADTLIGGIVNYGSTGMPAVISAEELDHIIDSTKQLMIGANTNDQKKSFFLPPFTLKKITSQTNAKLVGSFKPIPYKVDEDKNGNIPEVYKFFTNKQKRETLNDLMKEREAIKKNH